MNHQKAFLVLLVSTWAGFATANELVVESAPSGYVLVNTSPFPLLGIKVGQRMLSEMAPGARISFRGRRHH